jgi:hypothetical protein
MAPLAFNFNLFMEKEKLATNGSNFTSWALNLRILLNAAKKSMCLEHHYVNRLQKILPLKRKIFFRLVRRTTV